LKEEEREGRGKGKKRRREITQCINTRNLKFDN
jgi:hypothetical protein